MSSRTVRVNELVRREISGVMHRRWRSEAVYITITDVDVSPDLRNARVYYSILGGEAHAVDAEAFFRDNGKEIKRLMSKSVVLKYTPALEFIRDDSLERGAILNELIDELEPPDEDE